MKRFAFKRVRSKLTFWFVVLGLLPLFIGIVITYSQQASSIEQETFDKLTAIRDLKVEQLRNWLNERTGDLKTISTDGELVALQIIFHKEHKDQSNLNIHKNIRGLLNRYLKNYDAYDEIFIINPPTGIVEISTNANSEGTDQSDNAYFTRPIKTRELFIKDIYYSKSLARNTMTFSIPIFCTKHVPQHIVGILVARVDLKNSLYALLQNRVGLGKTGETLIVNKDVLVLNELRWHENAPLNLQINADPAVKASQGQTGIVETTDYRDEKILAAYTYIPETGWGFVAKQDLSELNAPMKSMMVNFLVLIIGALIAILAVAFSIARTIAAPVIDMAATAEKMQKGELSVRNRITGADELAALAETFNTMAESIESQVELREINDEITQTLVDAKDLPAFRTNMLKKLVAVTGSQMGAYFALNMDTKIFEHFTSIGITPGLLKPFDGSTLEGELGMVVETKKVTHIKDIPEDSIFKFRTFTGTIIPKEIISIPIIIDDVVSGIVSLASIKPYPRKVLDIMKQPWTTGFGTALSNMQANDETKRLAEELKGKNQELQAQTEELQAQSEELQAQNTELDAQRQQVEEANRLKSEFLSNMSHELRTPLNSVMALSRVLIMQTKEKISEEEANYLEIIERNGKQLLSLINDILDLSKIEAGRMDVSPKMFSLKSAIEVIMESLEPLAEEKGIEITQQIPEDLPRIESDESRVHQILQNIIGNGVKFTNKGSVAVSVSSDTEKVYIEVKDTGIGISNKDLPYIFEEFRQVDGSSSRPFEGTGLGLTIAYKAAKMLGGDISVESAPGKGTTFTVTLPLKWEGIAAVYGPIITKSPSETISEGQKTVLVVDDDPNVVAMISKYLSGEGYNTITATSGKKALELAETHRPFAITLDVIMPEMDGWEVLQNLKKNPVTADIPVIIVSVSDDRETGIALGAVGSITKPFTRDALIIEINKIGRPRPHSIMVVDDNEIDIREMAGVIEEEGIKTVLAHSGSKCIAMLKEALPDILVLDLMMPEMDGFEVLDRIRMDPETGSLPVIIVTARDLTIEDRKRLEGSVTSILAKSDTTSEALLGEIKRILMKIEGHPESPKDKRILLVEDNESSVIQVKSTLESEGFIVDVALDGEKALGHMRRSIPDGIILDLMMPGMDGFEVLEKMRSTEATAGIPVLILTAKDLTPDDLKRLKSNNIQQLIQKGDIDRQDLLNKTRQMLGVEPAIRRMNIEHRTSNIEHRTSNIEHRMEGNKAEHGVNAQPATRNSQLATILVVEDNPDNLTTLKAVLQGRYEILEATDGEAGLKTALAELPDLVLLDMSLPGMDGFEVVRNIRKDENARHIPVIALTARAMKGDREKTMEAGCDDYISKPIDPEEILTKIEKWEKKP